MTTGLNFKPGDEVAIETGYGYTSHRIERVLRVTPTGRIVVTMGSGDATFDKHGRKIGEKRYERVRLMPVTDQIRNAIECSDLASKLALVRWGAVDLETLRAIDALLKGKAE